MRIPFAFDNWFPFFPVFDTECKYINTCAARLFCQRLYNDENLHNVNSTAEAYCDFCLQWFLLECLTISPVEIGDTEDYLHCGCHIIDIREDMM